MKYNKEKLIDMHAHTNYSDGELSPYELIKLAIERNIGTLAITDHDTLLGVKQIDKDNTLIKDNDIRIINGIELSAKAKKGQIHILGYNININDEYLNRKMSILRDNSLHSVLSIMEQLKIIYGIRFSYDDIKELINSNHNLGRPDLARLCIKYGYATTVKEAFEKYLEEAKKRVSVSNKGLPYQECIELISNSGGVPVLAHPKSLKLDEKEFLIVLNDMIECGLKGIEVYHSTHTKEEMDYYLKIANEYNLLVSGGSDYHGINTKPDIELGTGRGNNLKIKQLSLLDNINKKNV